MVLHVYVYFVRPAVSKKKFYEFQTIRYPREKRNYLKVRYILILSNAIVCKSDMIVVLINK